MDGVIVADKPPGLTSHDVVNRVRRLAETRRVGHLGTLDPMATGVLPLVIGKATRLSQYLTGGEKKYSAGIRFGYSTDTYDREGIAASDPVTPSIGIEELEIVLGQFRGTFLQTPPPVSAKKVGGTPAYKLARRQVPVQLQPVEITVSAMDLVSWNGTVAEVSIHCSTGTYVRSIAHELGQRFGCGAVLDSLRRTASSGFDESQSRTLETLAALAAEGRIAEAVIPGAQLLPQFPCERVDALTAGQIRQGRDFRLSPFRPQPDARFVKAVTDEGELIAIGEARMPHVYHPVLVL